MIPRLFILILRQADFVRHVHVIHLAFTRREPAVVLEQLWKRDSIGVMVTEVNIVFQNLGCIGTHAGEQ